MEIRTEKVIRDEELRTYGEREVLAQGVTFESIVCENTTEIWVTGKEDAVEIPNLSLVPVDYR